MEDQTRKKLVKRKVNAPFTSDDPRINRNGRPKGAITFKTKFYMFLDKVAKDKNVSIEEIEAQLFDVGLKKAAMGDYNFYKDVFDRVYGKAVQPTEVTVKEYDEEAIKKRVDEIVND